MATLSQMMVVAIVLGTSTDLLVVARGVVVPNQFSQAGGSWLKFWGVYAGMFPL